MDIKKLTASANTAINRHGHAFQQAVVSAILSYGQDGPSRWKHLVSELPVVTQGAVTHIDLVAEQIKNGWGDSLRDSSPLRRYAIFECKRVNPSLGAWVFFKSPHFSREQLETRRIFDVLIPDDEEGRVTGYSLDCRYLTHRLECFNLGYPIKIEGEKGDAGGSGRSDIKDACTQVIRGVNGFLNTLPRFLKGGKMPDGTPLSAVAVPLIVTTAKLYVCDADPGTTDIMTGNLKLSDEDIKEVNNVTMQYPVSQLLRSSIQQTSITGRLDDFMYQDCLRTIDIVTASGLHDWLTKFHLDGDDIEKPRPWGSL